MITPAYNAERYLASAIRSVLAQTYSDFDLVVVDDGSTDGTPEIIAQYSDRVVGIRQANAGEGGARNTGFELAGGEYVALLDADDIWEPTKLETQVRAMDQNRAAGLCYTDAVTIGPAGDVLSRRRVPRHDTVTAEMVLLDWNPLVASSVLLRRRYLERRPYRADLPFAADTHVNLKALWRSGNRAVHVAKPLVRYRLSSTSVLGRADCRERGRSHTRAIKAFMDDVDAEHRLPSDLRKRSLAFCRYKSARYCICAGAQSAFAAGELARAATEDWHLTPRVVREFVKLGAALLGVRSPR